MARGCWLVVLLIASALHAQTTAPTTRPALTDEQLLTAVQKELGPLYHAGDRDNYLAVHGLIEAWFAAGAMKDRTAIAKQLEATGVDANIIGRLIRIRRHWHDLTPGTYYINEQVGPHELKYFLGVPNGYDKLTASPLVIVLPTADAFLGENPPDGKQVVEIYKGWMKEELARQRDALVLMPLLNLDELYGPSRLGMNSVIQPMLYTAEIANVDPARVYLMGHSLGGHATWNLALHYPTYFAAVAPLGASAGADWQRLRLMNLRNVLPVVWHDTHDEVIPIDSARSIVRAIRGLKLDIQYYETKNLGHAVPPQVLANVVETLRARRRELYPKEVLLQSNKPETIFNRADWVQIYQPMRPGDERKQLLGRGTGPMRVYANAYNVKAKIDGQKVLATTDNVEILRFYFNDQMVDMSKSISISVNGRVRGEGRLKPDIDAMLKDSHFLGRGWRYYSAYVDIDFGPPPSTRPTTRPTTRPEKQQ